MAETKFNLVQKYPWLLAISGIVLVVFIIFVIKEESAFHAQSVMQNVTLQQVGQLKPTSGTYQVSGGRLDFVYAQAVGFENDADKDAGTNYDSYVPLVEPATRTPIILVKLPGLSPSQLIQHIDDPPEKYLIGVFQDPSSVDPVIYKDFAARGYKIGANLPVMQMWAQAEDPSTKIIIAAIVSVVVGGLPWLLMYFIGRPKKRRKTFSERYPTRKVY